MSSTVGSQCRMEYRATMTDRSIVAFNQERTIELERMKGIAQATDENEYDYRLRVLRELTGQDIAAWELSPVDAPVIHAPDMVQPPDRDAKKFSGVAIGLILFILSLLGTLVLVTFHA